MQSNKKHAWVGLDVGKTTFFAAADLPLENNDKQPLLKLPAREFKRTEVGCGSFLKWLSESFPDYNFSVVMETTGCYSLQLRKWLHAVQPDLPVAIQNARLVSDFIKSLNLLHKTDLLDARAIARFGTERMPPPMQIKSKNAEMLQELSRERNALIKVRTALMNRRESINSPSIRKINGRVLATLTAQIAEIEKEIEKIIREDEDLSRQAMRMISVPGVNMISACAILAEFGSLSQYSSRQLSALSGLVPKISSSGSSLNQSCLSKRGAGRTRQLLYMNSLTAVNKIPELQALYQRIIAKGKTKMTARCACMRKLLLILRVTAVENREYRDFSQKNNQTALDF